MVFLFWKFAGRRQERLGKDVGKFLAVLPDLIKFWCFFFWGSLWHLRRACLCPQEAVKSIFNLMFRSITWFLTLALHYFLYFWNMHFCRHNSLLAYITSVILGFNKSAQRTWILVTPIHWIEDVFIRGDVVGGFWAWRNAFCFCFPASWHNSFFSLKTAKSCTSCQTKVFVSPFEFFEFWKKKGFLSLFYVLFRQNYHRMF